MGPLYSTIGQQHGFNRLRYPLRLGEKPGFFIEITWSFETSFTYSLALSKKEPLEWMESNGGCDQRFGVREHGVIRNRNLVLEVNSEELGAFHTCSVFP